MMNPLIDKLPETVKIDGAEVPINWDFRFSIKFSDLMSGYEGESESLVEEALRLYYPTIDEISNLEEAMEQMLWFYRGGKEERKRRGSSKEILSYSHDAGYISAAFLEQYQIDFQEIDTMHWWKFRALFDSLKDDTQIVKIMGYRGADLGKMSKEEKEFYKKMQKEYALPKVSKAKQELLDQIDKALMEGGDVSALIEQLRE